MKRFWIPFLILIFVLAGCGGTSDNPAQSSETHPPAEAEVVVDSKPNESAAEESSTTENTPIPPTDTPTKNPENPDVVHWEFPGRFNQAPLQSISDCITGRYFIPGQEFKFNKACDQWERIFFERPVEEGGTIFFPQLDIIESSFGQDENWYYTRILVFSEMVEDLVLDGIYALEIDVNLDARGDFLIIAAAPGLYPPDEWHSNSVQVWFDSNDDVGGPTAVLVDPLFDGDGYETLLVSSGLGNDPDLAFVKTSSEEPGLIEFGFKASLLGGVESFEWWVWAMREDVGAAKYDPVDFFPQDTLFAMDNTCGWIFGSYLRNLPNICEAILAPKQISNGTSTGACKPGTPAIIDPCYKWNQSTCSWGWDFSCIN